MLDKSLSAPVSARGLFGGDSDSDGGFDNDGEETVVTVAGVELRVRQRPFHPLNANAVWPGAHVLAEWLRSNADALRGKSILELGSATGAVALVATALGLNITTSDVDDGEVEECIAANFVLNGVQPAAHIPHSWGDPLPHTLSFDVVIASDILLYTKSYDALLDTLVSLCSPSEGRPRGAVFHMSWQRRLKESDVFFQKAVRRGFVVTPHPQRMFELALAPLVLD